MLCISEKERLIQLRHRPDDLALLWNAFSSWQE